MEPILTTKEFIEEVRKDIVDRINRSDIVSGERFSRIDVAQAHTNGDVSALKMWRGYITGALAVITVIVIPLLVYVWNQAQKQRSKLDALSNYEQSYEITTNDQNH